MATALSLLTLAAMVLLVGALVLWRRGGSRMQIALMVLAAVVMVINVAIWTLPDANGHAPIQQGLE